MVIRGRSGAVGSSETSTTDISHIKVHAFMTGGILMAKNLNIYSDNRTPVVPWGCQISNAYCVKCIGL
jgi:hypothetical protein